MAPPSSFLYSGPTVEHQQKKCTLRDGRRSAHADFRRGSRSAATLESISLRREPRRNRPSRAPSCPLAVHRARRRAMKLFSSRRRHVSGSGTPREVATVRSAEPSARRRKMGRCIHFGYAPPTRRDREQTPFAVRDAAAAGLVSSALQDMGYMPGDTLINYPFDHEGSRSPQPLDKSLFHSEDVLFVTTRLPKDDPRVGTRKPSYRNSEL